MCMEIALLGLGIIGLRCADHLESAGHQLRRWNRTPGKHPRQNDSLISAVAGASAVCLYLKDREAIRSIAPQILPQMHGAMLLNHSTIDLETTLWLNDACAAAGVRFVDAPFTGSKLAANDGKLFYYLGCAPEDEEQAKTIIAPTSSGCLTMGACGKATVVKLATNLIAACQIQAIAEAQALCGGYGVSDEAFTAVISSHGTHSALVKMKLPNMLVGDFDTHFSLENMHKDSVYAAELAAAKKLTLPSLHCVSQRMSALCRDGHGHKDYTALVLPYQQD